MIMPKANQNWKDDNAVLYTVASVRTEFRTRNSRDHRKGKFVHAFTFDLSFERSNGTMPQEGRQKRCHWVRMEDGDFVLNFCKV